ncbi:unnamed protein product [Diatraea saccharalis]|uniref:C2H2-type domain-containing protein n=1 Tax=Diatraea saccharalis TaxID=40085 RepID=A0A9N9R9T7_9NEOP|nr:unnamed protein product [Diatraea saccharalis]
MQDQQKKVHYCPHEGCNATFSRPYRVTDHLYAAHTNVRAYACQEAGCSKSYSNKSHLIRHINTVHKHIQSDVLYSCPLCLKTFVNRQNLKRHVKVQHTLKNYFICDICKISFKKKNQLRAHMYQHTGIKSFICEICPNKGFVTLYDKKRHMRCHKTYNCVECQLQFNVWSEYQKHRKIVHEVAEYICNECSRSFKQRSHIVRHVKIHSQILLSKLYKCPYENCPRLYTRNSNLKQHILIKHVTMTHECVICKAHLSSKACLKIHLKRHENPSKGPKIAKTKATGRKERKDKGIPRSITALKLAGCEVIIEEADEEFITPE